MNTKRLLPIIITLCLCTASAAQDIIITKDARKIEAESIEVTPRFIKYKIFGKPFLPEVSIPVKEVEAIYYENGDIFGDTIADVIISRKAKRPFISGNTIHWRIGSTFSYDDKHYLNSFDPLRVSMGLQMHDYFFAGMGVGFSYFPDVVFETGEETFETVTENGIETIINEYFDQIPQYKYSVFGVIHLSLPITKKIIPFLDIEGGISLSSRGWNDEIYCSPFVSGGLGFCFSHIEISGGYELFKAPLDRLYKPYQGWDYFEETNHPKGNLNFGNFYVKIEAKIGYLNN